MRLVVLFGSRAKGTARPSSDVDLGFISNEDWLDLTNECVRLLRTDRVDVVDLARASPLLAMAVTRYGRPLHEGEPAAWASFSSLSLRRYCDTAKLRRLREKGIRDYIRSKGL